MKEITYQTGDASRPEAPGAKLIVHVCNDVGAWGRGFVLGLSNRWPDPEREYFGWFHGGRSLPFALGQVQFVPVTPEITVANLIGQHGIRSSTAGPSSEEPPPVRYDAIRTGLRRVAAFAQENQASIHLPRIGCGLAGGRWEEIEPILHEELCAHDLAVTVYDLPSQPAPVLK